MKPGILNSVIKLSFFTLIGLSYGERTHSYAQPMTVGLSNRSDGSLWANITFKKSDMTNTPRVATYVNFPVNSELSRLCVSHIQQLLNSAAVRYSSMYIGGPNVSYPESNGQKLIEYSTLQLCQTDHVL